MVARAHEIQSGLGALMYLTAPLSKFGTRRCMLPGLGVLRGSGAVISGDISKVILLTHIRRLLTTHGPPSKGFRGSEELRSEAWVSVSSVVDEGLKTLTVHGCYYYFYYYYYYYYHYYHYYYYYDDYYYWYLLLLLLVLTTTTTTATATATATYYYYCYY